MSRQVAATPRFDTPASLRDLPSNHAFYDIWHETVAGLIDSVRAGKPRGEFFDPSEWDLDPAAERVLTWQGFPRAELSTAMRDDRLAAFQACEQRLSQREYLEWHTTKQENKVTKVVFVTETPEYWEALARADRRAVVELYHRHVSPDATEAEVFSAPDGGYRRDNVWNAERGIVHYIQEINTLEDAINLAQGAVDTGDARDNFEVPIDDATGTNAADPRVALDIGVLARHALSVTLRDPVGLFMVDWDDTGWTRPDGSPVGDYWRVSRGEPTAALRLEYEVPSEEGFAVGDIRIGGRPIEFGGQIAEHVTVGIAGLAGARRT